MSLLEAENLEVFYGRLQAVRALSFRVDEGQIVTLLGANGAGKTSTIRAVAGLVKSQGELRFDGGHIGKLPVHRRVRLGIATVPESRELFPSLTVDENLRAGAYRRKGGAQIRADLQWIYELFPGLQEKRTARAGSLSGGQAQMLAIGRALMTAPRLLLLDEPSHGLAPNLVEEVFALIPKLRDERGPSILLVEQNANKALAVASYGYVLEAGNLALEGPTSELANDPRVSALYLGGTIDQPAEPHALDLGGARPG